MFPASMIFFQAALLAAGAQPVLLENVPHVAQKPDFCGEACAEMALRKLGKSWTQDDVFDAAGIDPALGRGLVTAELKRALDKIGFRTGAVWYAIDPDEAEDQIAAEWRSLLADLNQGVPSIICMHFDARPNTTEHFRLILGFDRDKNEVIYHEPAHERAAYKRMKLDELFALWPLKYREDRWTLIRLRLDPGTIADKAPAVQPGRFRPADFAQHILALREKLPGGFKLVIEAPFVVVGDMSEEKLQRHAQGTVRWAVNMLRQDYFNLDPADILTVWLFKDAESYEKNTKKIFGEKPDTPYGYYSSRHKALIMNIATGGGTLVHEIVHPYVAANIEDAPAWFNEGLGSLYEQCGERDGHIIGYTNWRLEGLKEAIAEGSVPSFKALTAMSDDKFYGRGSGTHYAASRYLLFYLQEKGLLQTFYRSFMADRSKDPSGYRALVKTLGGRDMTAFEAEWNEFVLGLRFPE